MFRLCVLALFGCVVASAQYQIHQQDEGIPPHLLRQYIGQGQQHRPAPIPAPARLAYNVQEEQYQPRAQYQPQPQPQHQPQPQPQHQPQAQPQPQQYRQQQQQQPEDFDHNPSYQFGFDVNDDQFTNYQNRKEQRDGDVIKGSYSVVDSDGFIRTVTYTADPKEGFKAEVSRQPTDIVVKIPTPKPQTLSAPQPIAHQPHQPHQPHIQHQPQIPHQPHQPHQPQVARQPSPQQQYYRYE